MATQAQTTLATLKAAYMAALAALDAHYDRDAALASAMASAPAGSAEYQAARAAYESEHCSRDVYSAARRHAWAAYMAAALESDGAL